MLSLLFHFVLHIQSQLTITPTIFTIDILACLITSILAIPFPSSVYFYLQRRLQHSFHTSFGLFNLFARAHSFYLYLQSFGPFTRLPSTFFLIRTFSKCFSGITQSKQQLIHLRLSPPLLFSIDIIFPLRRCSFEQNRSSGMTT